MLNYILDIDILEEKKLEENEKVLKDIFLINIEEKENWFNRELWADILESKEFVCLFYEDKIDEELEENKCVDLEYFLKKLKCKKEHVLEKIHDLTIQTMKNYYISFEDLSLNKFDQPILAGFYDILLEGLRESMCLNLYLVKKLRFHNNRYITLEEAFKKYRDFDKEIDLEITKKCERSNNRKENKIINDTLKTYVNNIVDIKETEIDTNKIFSIFLKYNGKITINSDISNMVMYYAYNWKKHFQSNISKFKEYTLEKWIYLFNHDISPLESIIFEKITSKYISTAYIFYYYKDFELENRPENIRDEIIEDLIHLLNISNFRCYKSLVDKINLMYNNRIEIDLRKLSIYMKNAVIPLYNMIFSNIVKRFCSCNEIDVKFFLEWYVNDDKNTMESEYKRLFQVIKGIEKDDIRIDYVFNKIKEFDNQESIYEEKVKSIFVKIGEINEKLIEIGCEKTKIQEYIKRFILDLLVVR